MRRRRSARRKIVRDLTRTRHMTIVSAVVLGTTFMPLLGIPEVYELQAFRNAVEGFSDARAHAFAPGRNDEAARERSARAVAGERAPDRPMEGGAEREYRILTVERPDHQPVEMYEAAELPPLPAEDELELTAPVEAEAFPDEVAPVEQKPEAVAPEEEPVEAAEHPPLEDEEV